MKPPWRVNILPGASGSASNRASRFHRSGGIAVMASPPLRSSCHNAARSLTPSGQAQAGADDGDRLVRRGLGLGQPLAQLADLEQRPLDRAQVRAGVEAHRAAPGGAASSSASSCASASASLSAPIVDPGLGRRGVVDDRRRADLDVEIESPGQVRRQRIEGRMSRRAASPARSGRRHAPRCCAAPPPSANRVRSP